MSTLTTQEGNAGFAGEGMDPYAMGIADLIVGAIPAAVLGGFGVLVVHGTTLHARSQIWHVLAAGLVGLAMALALTFGSVPALWWIAPVATMSGRAAVIPMVRRRQARLGAQELQPA